MPRIGARKNSALPAPDRRPKLLKPADLPDSFTRSLYKIAPYRGCGHGCRYCDGRAERYYVEGDFERNIEIRRDIPERLERELPLVRERGIVGFGSGVTDPYQPLEAVEDLSGRCARALASSRRPLPAMVMTKSSLVQRDLQAWKRLNERAGFLLLVSITSIDESIRERMEPGASRFTERIEMLRAFKAAGCATGALAMPFLPGISDSIESIRSVYSACRDAGVDFIMPGGLTLRPGRQKICYLETLASYYPAVSARTIRAFREDRPSGTPTREAMQELQEKIHCVQEEFDMPYLLPHTIYAKLLPTYDSLRILFRDMMELYRDHRVDTASLRVSADRYDSWLVSLRREYRRKRSLSDDWLDDRFKDAAISQELGMVLGNAKLLRFVSSILFEGARLNYRSLKLG